MTSVTVLSGRERGGGWTASEELRNVSEILSADVSVAEFARRHDVHPNLVHAWRRQARTGELSLAADGTACFVPVSVATESVAPPSGNDKGSGSAIEGVFGNGLV